MNVRAFSIALAMAMSSACAQTARLPGTWDACVKPHALLVASPDACISGWRPLGRVRWRDLRHHPDVVLRNRLPDVLPAEPILVVPGAIPNLAIYTDTSAIYHYGPDRFYSFHVVPLPPAAAGKRLYLLMPRAEFGGLGVGDIRVAASDAVPSVLNGLTGASLRGELAKIALGTLVGAMGVAIIAIFFLRRRSRDLGLIYFGSFCLLYGGRLLFETRLFMLTSGRPPGLGFWINAVITYGIGIPALLLVIEAIGTGWKSSLKWALGLQLVFFALAVTSDLIQGEPFTMNGPNAVMAIITTVAALGNMFFARIPRGPGLAALKAGFVIFTAAVINDNLQPWHFQPLPMRTELLGFLALLVCLGHYVLRRAFNQEEKLIAIEHELETARRIQQSILPRETPRVSSLSLAVRYVPMSAVAGDFYDFVRIDEHRAGILVADVSGHGVPAALVASMVKVAFAGQQEHAADPARVLNGMNQTLHGRVQTQFVTAVYAFIDANEGAVVYASAGHPPVLVRRAAGNTVEKLAEGGLMLGPFPNPGYANHTVRLHPGDRVLLYTDGIIEAANSAGEFYGDQVLQSFVLERSAAPADQFTDELLKDVAAWSKGEPQGDDLTIVTVDFATSPVHAAPAAFSGGAGASEHDDPPHSVIG